MNCKRWLKENKRAIKVKSKDSFEQLSLFETPGDESASPEAAREETAATLFPREEVGKDVVEPEAPEDRINSLEELRPIVMSCQRCELRKGATNVVFGEGNPQAMVMFVGEGPGATEDATGRPFVGRAGQLLDVMLKSAGLERKDVFIANIVKCRPPGNRLPLPPEVTACLPYLKAQIRIIKPRILVLLGALSSQTLVDPSIRVTKDRGKWFHKDGIDYLVTFHPAAVLRDETGKKRLMWEDFQSLKQKLCEVSTGNAYDRSR